MPPGSQWLPGGFFVLDSLPTQQHHDGRYWSKGVAMVKSFMTPGEFEFLSSPLIFDTKEFTRVFCERQMHGSPHQFVVSGTADDNSGYATFIVVFDPHTRKVRQTARFICSTSPLHLVS